MATTFKGNVVAPDGYFYGSVTFDEKGILEITQEDAPHDRTDFVLAGFIEMHLHGTGPYTTETADGVAGMARYAVTKGTTRFCPTTCCAHDEFYLKLLPDIARLRASNPPGAVIDSVYMEGPWVSQQFRGGMHEDLIHPLTVASVDRLLDCAPGLIKVMAIAPEEPGAMEIVRHLASRGIVVSLAHSACPPDLFPQAVAAGVRQMTHLFDAYDLPTDVKGVRQAAITDLGLIDDRVMKEVIMDGRHVPPPLVRLAIRAAGYGHILAITDALQGAGMSHVRFQDMGTWYHIEEEGDLALVEADGSIVGSSLTMNMAFFNLVTKFGCTPCEASQMLSANQARVLGLAGQTGELRAGLRADITLMSADCRTVKACHVGGREAFAA